MAVLFTGSRVVVGSRCSKGKAGEGTSTHSLEGPTLEVQGIERTTQTQVQVVQRVTCSRLQERDDCVSREDCCGRRDAESREALAAREARESSVRQRHSLQTQEPQLEVPVRESLDQEVQG